VNTTNHRWANGAPTTRNPVPLPAQSQPTGMKNHTFHEDTSSLTWPPECAVLAGDAGGLEAGGYRLSVDRRNINTPTQDEPDSVGKGIPSWTGLQWAIVHTGRLRPIVLPLAYHGHEGCGRRGRIFKPTSHSLLAALQ